MPFLSLAFAFQVIALFLFLGDPVEGVPVARLVFGALYLYLFSGLIWAEVLRFGRQPFFSAFVYTFWLGNALFLMWLPLGFAAKLSLVHLVWLFWLTNMLGITWLYRRYRQGESLVLLGLAATVNRKDRHWKFHWAMSAILSLMTILVSVAPHDPMSVAREKLIHLSFVRQYFSAPLDLFNLGLAPGVLPPNLVHFWEFQVALWARLIQADPIAVFFAGHALTPWIGLSAMYMLVHQIFREPRTRQAIFVGMMLLAASRFLIVYGSPDWPIIAEDVARGLFAFMSSSHHADLAQEVWMPALMGLSLAVFRRGGYEKGLLLTAAVASTFLTHPREFFQVLLYLGFFSFLLLLAGAGSRTKNLRRIFRSFGPYFGVALAYLGLQKILLFSIETASNEAYWKLLAVKKAFLPQSLTSWSSLEHFPLHFIPSLSQNFHLVINRNHFDSFRELTVLLALVLLLLCRRRNFQLLGMYVAAFWLLFLCWDTGLYLVFIATYNEFFMTTPRLLYLFYYLCIPAALWVLLGDMTVKKPALLAFGFLSVFGWGQLLRHWETLGAAWSEKIFDGLTGVIVVLVVIRIFFFDRRPRPALPATFPWLWPLLLALIIVPVKLDDLSLQASFFSNQTPMDQAARLRAKYTLSQELVGIIEKAPTNSVWFSDPSSHILLPPFFAQQQVPLPNEITSIISFSKQQSQVRKAFQEINLGQIEAQIKGIAPDFVLLRRADEALRTRLGQLGFQLILEQTGELLYHKP